MSRERKWCMLTNWQHGERSRSYRKVNSTVSQELVVAVGFFGFFKWHDRYKLDVSKFYHPLRRIWFVFIFDRFLWSVLRSLDRRKRHLECCSFCSVIMLKTSPNPQIHQKLLNTANRDTQKLFLLTVIFLSFFKTFFKVELELPLNFHLRLN